MTGAAKTRARPLFGCLITAALCFCFAVGPVSTEPVRPLADDVLTSRTEDCRSCHPRQWREWRESFHARSLRTQGFVKNFKDYIEQMDHGWNRQNAMACFDCHAPLLKQAEDAVVVNVAQQILEGRTRDLEAFGVNCAACHRTDGAFAGPIENPVPNPFHESVHTKASEDARACQHCHTWRPPSIPCSLVFDSWTGSEAAAAGRSCQTCHMPAERAPAAIGGPERTVHAHRFGGGRSPELLKKAVALSLASHFESKQLRVVASLENLAGHHVPDG